MEIVLIILLIIILPTILKKLAYAFGYLCGTKGPVGDAANILLWIIRNLWIVVVIWIIFKLI